MQARRRRAASRAAAATNAWNDPRDLAAPDLNFGDGMAYAVARAHDAPLLFKGDGFSRTGVRLLPV